MVLASMVGSSASNEYGKGGTVNATGLSSTFRLRLKSDLVSACNRPGAALPAPSRPAPTMPLLTRNLRRSMETPQPRWALQLARGIIAPQPSRLNRTEGSRRPNLDTGIASYWMRPKAHRAESAIADSADSASLCKSARIGPRSGASGASLVLPNAMQALRTNPFHLVRFMALPRKASRNSSSLIPASHSRRGSKSDSPANRSPRRPCSPGAAASASIRTCAEVAPHPPRGWNSAKVVTGALRLNGQTSWQISQPYTCLPMASRNSSGIFPRNSMVRYEMQRRASSTYGSTSAPVGQASRHCRQFPQRSAGGASAGASDGAKPSDSFSNSVFLPSQPSPAYLAKIRSATGPVSAYARVANGSGNLSRREAASALSFSQSTS